MPQQRFPQQEPNQLVAQFEKSLESLNPENRKKIDQLLAASEAPAFYRLIDEGLAAHVKAKVNPDITLRPLPASVMRTPWGKEQIQKLIKTGLKKVAEMKEPVAQIGGQPQGLAAPRQQVPQQAPVSPPAPTGLVSRPQLPLPSSSNPVPNQPIR